MCQGNFVPHPKMPGLDEGRNGPIPDARVVFGLAEHGCLQKLDGRRRIALLEVRYVFSGGGFQIGHYAAEYAAGFQDFVRIAQRQAHVFQGKMFENMGAVDAPAGIFSQFG